MWCRHAYLYFKTRVATMKKRQLDLSGIDFDSISLGEVWSAVTSEFGEILSDGTTPTAQPSDGKLSATVQTMITTAVVSGPVSTLTVGTTIIRTSYVTVPATTEREPPKATACSGPNPPDSCTDKPSPTTTNGSHTSLPAVVTDSPTMTVSFKTHSPLITPSATAAAESSTNHSARKHAIIGGLSGTIAGLVLIGVLICVWMRRKRPRDDEDESISEKGLRPAIARKWSELTTSRSVPISAPLPTASRGTSTPDFDGGLIRMSLEHWPRPFAHGESFRESIGPRRLQVMNPDLSKPTTPVPRGSSETEQSFLKRQRSAITAALLGAKASSSNSIRDNISRDAQVPAISIDPAHSTEFVAPNAPSFRSYPSVSSVQLVQQQPPEDPFLTPPDERDEIVHESAQARPRRPSLAPLQNAAGAAGRTLSHIGSALNPFRSKSNYAESAKTYSRNSVSTFSSAGDPFQLDRPSIRESTGVQGRMGGELERERMPNMTMYEGT